MASIRATDDLETLAPLADPVRRALFRHVVDRAESRRDQAASALGITRSLAAFHMDKLVDAGLLRASYRRPEGKTGPGAGRPAKVYRLAEALEVSVPSRDYRLAARLLVEGLPARGRDPSPATLRRAARDAGLALGGNARRRAGARPSRAQLRRALVRLLAERGFRPGALADGTIVLRNCPFDALATEFPETICQMNRSLLAGVLAGVRLPLLEAAMDPAPGRCCLVLRPPR